MRLLFNASTLRSEGGVVLMQHLLEALLKHREDLHILLYHNPLLTQRTQGWLTQWEQAGIQVERVETVPFHPQGGWRRFWWEQISLPRILKQRKIDVLLSFANTGPIFPGSCRQVLYVQQSIPYAHFQPAHHRLRWHTYRLLYGSLMGLAQLGSARIIVPTQWLVNPMRQSIAHLKPESAYCVSPPGLPMLPDLPPEKPFAPHEQQLLENLERWKASDERILLYPCYLAPYKNIPYLLEAIRYLAQQATPGFRLLLTFNEQSLDYFPCKEEVFAAVDQASTEHVVLTGSLSRAAMAQVYRRSDILVFPSLVETLGLPLMEAMSHGLPVVATQSAQPNTRVARFAQELCGDGALYADPNQPESFANQLALLLNDPDFAFKVGQNGLQRSRQFSWESHAKALLDEP